MPRVPGRGSAVVLLLLSKLLLELGGFRLNNFLRNPKLLDFRTCPGPVSRLIATVGEGADSLGAFCLMERLDRVSGRWLGNRSSFAEERASGAVCDVFGRSDPEE